MSVSSVSNVSQASALAPAAQWLKAIDLKIVGLAVGILCVLAIAVMAIRSLYARWKSSGQTTDSGMPTAEKQPFLSNLSTSTASDAAAPSTATSAGTAAAASSSVTPALTATTSTAAVPQSQTTPQLAAPLSTISVVQPKSKFEVAVDEVIEECQRQKGVSGNLDVLCNFQWGDYPFDTDSMKFSELRGKLPGWLKDKAGKTECFDLGVEVGMASGRYKMLVLQLK